MRTEDGIERDSKFPISLIIIAVLIPLFLDYFPGIIYIIIPFLPIYLKLDVVTIGSLILGFSWFVVLLIGLIQFERDKKETFYISFFIARSLTILIVGVVLFIYLTFNS